VQFKPFKLIFFANLCLISPDTSASGMQPQNRLRLKAIAAKPVYKV
jgi:hypothetical protein